MSAPLAGLKVVELARILAGPWAGQVLADLIVSDKREHRKKVHAAFFSGARTGVSFEEIVTKARKVDELVRVLGVDGISKSEVSRICAELDTARGRAAPR